MCRMALDTWDPRPYGMQVYLSNNGWHFNEKLCRWAVSIMRKRGKLGELEPIEAMSKERVDELLKRNGVTLSATMDYDYVYVANKVLADKWKSSIEDERHHALAIKDEVDDVDAADGTVMRQWYAMMVAKGIGIDWESFI